MFTYVVLSYFMLFYSDILFFCTGINCSHKTYSHINNNNNNNNNRKQI